MDFKKLGLVIIILRVIILGYGANRIGVNQPKKQETNEIGNWMTRRMDISRVNDERERERKKATNIMIAGGIVLIIGGGFRYSAKS